MNAYIFPAVDSNTQYRYCRYKNPNSTDKKRITAEIIMSKTCQYFEITRTELVSRCRRREYVEARQTSMWLIRKYTTLSLKTIGSFFNKRDHTTVLYSVSTATDLMYTDKEYLKRVNEIIKNLLD